MNVECCVQLIPYIDDFDITDTVMSHSNYEHTALSLYPLSVKHLMQHHIPAHTERQIQSLAAHDGMAFDAYVSLLKWKIHHLFVDEPPTSRRKENTTEHRFSAGDNMNWSWSGAAAGASERKEWNNAENRSILMERTPFIFVYLKWMDSGQVFTFSHTQHSTSSHQ